MAVTPGGSRNSSSLLDVEQVKSQHIGKRPTLSDKIFFMRFVGIIYLTSISKNLTKAQILMIFNTTLS